jgi:hypothetical protein
VANGPNRAPLETLTEPTTTEKERAPGSTPGTAPKIRPLAKATAPSPRKESDAAMLLLKHDGPSAAEALASRACRCCGHNPIVALRQILAERHEAWQAGVLEGYGTGWRDGLLAGIERRSAA